MKHGKTPTRKQSDRLKSLGLNPENWLVTKDHPTVFEVVHKVSGKLRRLGA